MAKDTRLCPRSAAIRATVPAHRSPAHSTVASDMPRMTHRWLTVAMTTLLAAAPSPAPRAEPAGSRLDTLLHAGRWLEAEPLARSELLAARTAAGGDSLAVASAID